MVLDELKIIKDLEMREEFSALSHELFRYVDDFCGRAHELTEQTNALIATGYRHLLGLALIQKEPQSCYKQDKE